MISTYLMLERREIVDRAQKTLKARRDELFVVDRIAQERGRLHGVLDGRRVSRAICEMPPGLRRNTVLDTGDGLEPLAVFLGNGGRMLLPSSWDKIRWRAWTRMRDHAKVGDVPMLPRTRWLFHDMRHTFALRLLIYLTREAMADGSGELPMSTLLDHMTYNPLLIVQRRLGHASPASTYRYVKYLKDPMREVDEAFQGWTAASGASYAEIARTMLRLDGDGDATQG
jgi:integrase